MKYILFRLKRFCGFITGFVFFIAGIFKLLDPVGTGLIMSGYFDFLHLNFLLYLLSLFILLLFSEQDTSFLRFPLLL